MTDRTRGRTTPAGPTMPALPLDAVGRMVHGGRGDDIRTRQHAAAQRAAKAARAEARHQAATRWFATIAGAVILLAAAAATILGVIALGKAVL